MLFVFYKNSIDMLKKKCLKNAFFWVESHCDTPWYNDTYTFS